VSATRRSYGETPRRIEGCSDREEVDRFAFDARWKYAAGGQEGMPAGGHGRGTLFALQAARRGSVEELRDGAPGPGGPLLS
jgi:hypothetical protein